ncbi:MAG: hypothetical protein HY666_02615 [Chloroflexi bacterium]|nr:hypothetical protein [Chloroflexota bacterium]
MKWPLKRALLSQGLGLGPEGNQPSPHKLGMILPAAAGQGDHFLGGAILYFGL